jgi:hypothetical protein
MALGARAADLVRPTLGRSIVLVAIGLGMGVAAALVATASWPACCTGLPRMTR